MLMDELKFEKFLKSFVQSSLRRASMRWKPRTEALQRARLERGIYQCAICKESFEKKQIQIDHIEPVISIKDGYTNFDDYIRRLFVPCEKLQICCLSCHDAKTSQEDSARAIHNKKRKKK